MQFWSRTLYIIFLVGFTIQIQAQELQKRLALSTPHDAIWVHLYYLQPENYEPGLSATAFIGGDSTQRSEWAIKLKQILDGEGLFVQMNLLPREADFQDSVSKKHYYTPFPEQLPEIYLERIDSQWHYSSESTKDIPELYRKVYPMGTHRLVSFFARSGSEKFLGISLWQLAGLMILVVLGIILHLLFSWFLRILIKYSSRSIETIEHYSDYVRKIAKVGSLYLLIWVLKIFYPLLQFPAKVNMVVQTIFKITLSILLMLVLLRAIKLFAAYLRSLSARTESRMDDQIVPIVEQILKIVVIVVALLNILHLLDFNVTALIAGVSIGGLALALAAQDTVKNFLGSVMIFTDKPFQIGDWVEGDGFVGSVVEVGFRSTRIRTSDTSIISVPNGSMANVSVTNKGVRQYRLFATNIGITYDTPPDLIEFFIKGLKEIIIHHPEVANDDYYVYFNDLASSSLNIFMRCYMKAPTYDDELRIRESIHFAVVRWAAKLGVRFAFPSSTLYIEEIPGQVSLAPTYKINPDLLQKKWSEYFQQFDEETSEDHSGQ
ncbi:MAG: mechanosensitive ion channel family protein [Saprospiraceae bacterium]|nr:mechanosensitive ion channel family protein [Saprospiraceae bacterium]